MQFDDDAFNEFWDRQLITDVITQIKTGKEACVYLCRANPDKTAGLTLAAAKVHRPRSQRSFRAEAPYLEGRGDLNRGRGRFRSSTRAINRRSTAGKNLLSESWVRREYDVLRRAARVGVRVPRPIFCTGRAILRQYLGDGSRPAPRLIDQPLKGDVALQFRNEILDAVRRLLQIGLIHADLSPYNVLVFADKPWLIDTPQSVDAAVHPDAYGLFRRDVLNVTRHFSRYGLSDTGQQWADMLWDQYVHGRL